jgi:hypothetical protein
LHSQTFINGHFHFFITLELVTSQVLPFSACYPLPLLSATTYQKLRGIFK